MLLLPNAEVEMGSRGKYILYPTGKTMGSTKRGFLQAVEDGREEGVRGICTVPFLRVTYRKE